MRKISNDAPDCPLCNVATKMERTAPPHWGAWMCPQCGKNRGWAATPPSEYPRYVMPYGRFMGKTLAEIAQRASGRSYLEWCAVNLKSDRVREVISVFLAQQVKTMA